MRGRTCDVYQTLYASRKTITTDYHEQMKTGTVTSASYRLLPTRFSRLHQRECEDTGIFDDIRHDHPSGFIAAYLNINSVRNKIIHIREALKRTPVDILGIAETKIDDSFPDSQFTIDGYRLFRRDRNDKGGGVMVYIRSDIPCRRVTDYETMSVELLALEVLPRHNGKQTKWMFMNAYKPPNISNGQFT